MMKKLWILRPVEGLKDSPWVPWYDKCFGMVISAEDESSARAVANQDDNGGDETSTWEKRPDQPDMFTGHSVPTHAWTSEELSTCVELRAEDFEGLVICDFHSA